ncbi:cytidine deaminase-like protein [Fimicolochytrium jonesii]|uniref:cytidine deaminase-like protein n=1 Tax=Fimicolochytrium jonesii TaxID=1396493 RepID=UPI0022FEBC50|nr:cytidine deaminase-like protein [Fimicolochytrium jonesii]KAI8820641.1 cytidine deaminase-like protein [Fimicolochytrium jonesii]
MAGDTRTLAEPEPELEKVDTAAETNTAAEAASTGDPAKPPKKKRPRITAPPTSHLSINPYDWKYDPSIAFDANYIDLACLVARNSVSLKGHMGAVLLSPPNSIQPQGEILHLSTNVPVFPVSTNKTMKSSAEIHAEANAIVSCARQGVSTQGKWIYVTFPPCKDCFMLIVYAGIKRICHRRRCILPEMKEIAQTWGIELVEWTSAEEDDLCKARCDGLVKRWTEVNEPDEPLIPVQ